MMAPCSNGVIKYNAVVVNSRYESIEFAVLIWPPPCIFNGHCDVGPLRMAPRLVLRPIGSRELQDGDFVRIVNHHLTLKHRETHGCVVSTAAKAPGHQYPQC